MLALFHKPLSGLPIKFHAMPFGFLEKHDLDVDVSSRRTIMDITYNALVYRAHA